MLPYLTANLRFIIDRRVHALVVPGASLRWQPSVEQVQPAFRAEHAARLERGHDKARPATVWVLEGDAVRPVEVQLGLSDGMHVEVVSGELAEGAQVVYGEMPQQAKQSVNPFVPSLTKSLER